VRGRESDIGQLDFGVAFSRDEPRIELSLELLDLIAERRSADNEAERGAAKVLVFGERHKMTEQARLNFRHR
jgi:hypothetical protein